ncbi:hypothetical protein GCM10023080_088460 [Streptomyces pseudoechinosporeus]
MPPAAHLLRHGGALNAGPATGYPPRARHRRQQGLGVGVLRVVQDRGGAARFDDPSPVHDDAVVADLPYHAEVVGDEEERPRSNGGASSTVIPDQLLFRPARPCMTDTRRVPL